MFFRNAQINTHKIQLYKDIWHCLLARFLMKGPTKKDQGYNIHSIKIREQL